MGNFNRLRSIQTGLNNVAVERARLKEERYKLVQEKAKIRAEVIGESFDRFMRDMGNQFRKRDYIRGAYTSDFTRHIVRTIDVNSEHAKAIKEYNNALQHLNSTFVNALQNDKETCARYRDRLMMFGTLKNLNLKS